MNRASLDKKLFIEDRRINLGDFLISRANTLELLGMPVIVHEVTKNLMLSDKVLRLVMPEHEKKWLNFFIRSPKGRSEIESRATGNQQSILAKAFKGELVPQDPSDEPADKLLARIKTLCEQENKKQAKKKHATKKKASKQ